MGTGALASPPPRTALVRPGDSRPRVHMTRGQGELGAKSPLPLKAPAWRCHLSSVTASPDATPELKWVEKLALTEPPEWVLVTSPKDPTAPAS